MNHVRGCLSRNEKHSPVPASDCSLSRVTEYLLDLRPLAQQNNQFERVNLRAWNLICAFFFFQITINQQNRRQINWSRKLLSWLHCEPKLFRWRRYNGGYWRRRRLQISTRIKTRNTWMRFCVPSPIFHEGTLSPRQQTWSNFLSFLF